MSVESEVVSTSEVDSEGATVVSGPEVVCPVVDSIVGSVLRSVVVTGTEMVASAVVSVGISVMVGGGAVGPVVDLVVIGSVVG